ncbi:hypothetical protein BU24DRAFT_254746 [Aaosphaeria arxii CBS 175.79]|uniref:Zn(2)-C6 fungal-type domain-containing protein n=1 Tax=Aaosphaeria arxii CBS 175.79 TaxID=1450172 RepID=A0A6A5XHJ0_9PLEO|nr:uncharacterized protein BU24DRAFT_254746 [Aaosphaeria arxii CBS 175.79]KAF2012582.1 hypothetical protein BU24DRAFT_254746 [Aaosphaeria arxii CBS 175.79]
MMPSDKVYKKRPHRKVKSGCIICKRRKIKCNEEKPQCANCARYSAECIYPSLSSEVVTSNGVMISTTPPSVQTPESMPYDEPVTPQYPIGSGDIPMRDLALLHHWTCSTSLGFGDDFPGAADPWRIDAPIIGQRFPFLMRGILSIAAIHLARISSDLPTRHKYIRLGAYHQDLALPEYRKALTDVTEENVAAVLVSAALAMVYSFAAPPKDSSSAYNHDARGWLFLHRGVREIPPQWAEWITKGPFKDEMRRRTLPRVDPTLNPEDYRLVRLYTLISQLPVEEREQRPHYEDAIYWLRQAFAHVYAPPEVHLGFKYAMLLWIERIPQGFTDLIQKEEPLAFVLLAHAYVLIKRTEACWWNPGLAKYLMSELQDHLSADLRPWVAWPLQVCGLT